MYMGSASCFLRTARFRFRPCPVGVALPSGNGERFTSGSPEDRRLCHARRTLYRAGKAPLIVFTGGWVPWRPMAEPEGQVLIKYALDMGIPQDHLLTTDKVVNTAEEAAAIAEMLQKRGGVHTPPRVLLVTSAYHMRRALLLFERAGLEVTPFRVDFQVSEGRKMTILDFIPNGGSLHQTEKALREVYGYLYYLIGR